MYQANDLFLLVSIAATLGALIGGWSVYRYWSWRARKWEAQRMRLERDARSAKSALDALKLRAAKNVIPHFFGRDQAS